MKTMLRACAVCLPLLAASACAEDSASQDTVLVHPDTDGVQRVHIVGGDYHFRPSRIVVRANMPVELLVSREAGIVPHNFVIDAPQAGIAVDEKLGDEPKRVRFMPTAAGSYPMYCASRLLFFKSHRERGMEGLLEVVAD